jgi:hypothetical protein
MESVVGSSCIYANRMYPSGTRIHGFLAVIECKDREWHDLDEGSIDSKPSLAYVYH